MQVSVFNNGPDPSHFRINVVIPTGVRYVSGLDCTGTRDLACVSEDAPVSQDLFGGVASFAAAERGSYTLLVRLTDLTVSDPDLTNNQASVIVNVVQHTLAASGFTLVPARSRAGSSFVVSFRVLDKTVGQSVVPTAAKCISSLGTARSRVLNGRATCVVKTPSSARGKTVRGTLTAVVGGRSVSQRFSVRLR